MSKEYSQSVVLKTEITKTSLAKAIFSMLPERVGVKTYYRKFNKSIVSKSESNSEYAYTLRRVNDRTKINLTMNWQDGIRNKSHIYQQEHNYLLNKLVYSFV